MSDEEGNGLGDRIAQALAIAGITKDRVSGWLGAPCACEDRQAKLNAIGNWAARVLSGKVERAKEFFDRIVSG